MRIDMKERAGSFAQDKDAAKRIREEELMPALDQEQEIILDFTGVEGATQSFIHALISDLIRKRGAGVLDQLLFKGCEPTIQKVIEVVVDYMQEA